MEYNWANPGKRKSDIKILERIAKNKGFPDEVITSVSEFLAERIEIIDEHYVCYSKLKKGIEKITNLADRLIKKNPEGASILYIIAGKSSIGLAGKLNDENFVEQAKECFSSIIECYKKLIENLDKRNEDKKEEYEFFSKEYEFLSNNAFRLKEIISHYYKLQKRTDDLINEINFEASISVPNLINHILDNINDLKKLNPDSIEAQKTKKVIDENSKFLPEESYNKIKSLTNKILSNYKN